MEYVYIGKIVNTHGIKGELRIISDFELKDRVFKKGFNLYIGKGYIKETINSYRSHKCFDMVLFEGYNNINEVLKYKYNKVYVKRTDLNLKENEYLISDLINMEAIFEDKSIGKVMSVINNNNYKLLDISGILIPLNKEFIEDIKDNKIILKNVGELI